MAQGVYLVKLKWFPCNPPKRLHKETFLGECPPQTESQLEPFSSARIHHHTSSSELTTPSGTTNKGGKSTSPPQGRLAARSASPTPRQGLQQCCSGREGLAPSLHRAASSELKPGQQHLSQASCWKYKPVSFLLLPPCEATQKQSSRGP